MPSPICVVGQAALISFQHGPHPLPPWPPPQDPLGLSLQIDTRSPLPCHPSHLCRPWHETRGSFRAHLLCSSILCAAVSSLLLRHPVFPFVSPAFGAPQVSAGSAASPDTQWSQNMMCLPKVWFNPGRSALGPGRRAWPAPSFSVVRTGEDEPDSGGTQNPNCHQLPSSTASSGSCHLCPSGACFLLLSLKPGAVTCAHLPVISTSGLLLGSPGQGEDLQESA